MGSWASGGAFPSGCAGEGGRPEVQVHTGYLADVLLRVALDVGAVGCAPAGRLWCTCRQVLAAYEIHGVTSSKLVLGYALRRAAWPHFAQPCRFSPVNNPPPPSSDPSIIGIFSAKKPQAVTIALSPTYRDGGNLGRRRRVKRRCRLLGLSATAQPLSGGGRPGRPYTRGGSGPEVGRGARPRKTRHGFQMGKSARRQSPLPRVLLRNPPWNRRASRRYLHGLAPGADAWCGHMVDCLDSPFAERPDQMVALPAIIAQWLKIQEVTDDCAASSQTPEPRVHQPFWRLPAWHCRLWA